MLDLPEDRQIGKNLAGVVSQEGSEYELQRERRRNSMRLAKRVSDERSQRENEGSLVMLREQPG